MPRGAGRKPSKPLALGVMVGAVGGVGWHIVDPPQWVVVAIEAVLLTVAILLLAIPHSPQTPNLNPISQLIDAHA